MFFSSIFRNNLFLSFTSFYLFITFYLINNSVLLIEIQLDQSILKLVNYSFYILIGILISYLGLRGIYSNKKTDDISQLASVKPAEISVIPIYLGLIIISLEFSSFVEKTIEILFFGIILFIIWSRLDKIIFFNFFWLFLGYRFYEIKTDLSHYLLISKKKDIKNKISFEQLKTKRINNFVFLDVDQND